MMSKYVWLMVLWLVASGLSAAAAPPNLIVVLIDDMGWGDFSCFGNKEVETTNIDRLASEGLRFEQFYVNMPICSPSRVALSTGQYPHRWQVTSFLADRRANQRRGIAQWLDPAAPMLARTLHDAGYATGHFGKWHMGGQRDVGEAPSISKYGFDESLTNFEGLGPRVLPLNYSFNRQPPKRYALGSDNLGRGPIIWRDRSTITTAHTEAAVEFIEWSADNQRPFFVNVWPDDVHGPYFPPRRLWSSDGPHAQYRGVLKAMDDQLAPLFDLVRNDTRLRDNTLIVVCSDNGPDLNGGSAGPFRGLKATLYEGGIRSPLVVWGPGLIDNTKAGSVNRESIVAAIDVVPSFLALAGIESTAEYDGENLSATLTGKSTASRANPIFFRRPPDREQAYKYKSLPDLAVRAGQWKLLCDYDGSHVELYDVVADPGETKNLADERPEVVEDLRGQLLAWNAALPQDNGATFKAEK